MDLPFGTEKILKSKHNLCVCNVEADLYVEVFSGPKEKKLKKYPTENDPIKLDRVLHDPIAFIF